MHEYSAEPNVTAESYLLGLCLPTRVIATATCLNSCTYLSLASTNMHF